MSKIEFEIYTSFLTATHIYIKGRLLKTLGALSKDTDGLVISFFKTMFRALSKEVRNHPIQIEISGTSFNIQSDHEGYFQLFIPAMKLTSLRGEIYTSLEKNIITKEFYLRDYRNAAPLGIISDIDDTILLTNVKSLFKIRMFINTVLINPFRRKSINYSSLFYQHLINQDEGDQPVIYISNSPWNMHAYLTDFIKHNHFPEGEIQLRDFGLQFLRKKKPIEQQNKYLEVERVLRIFSGTKFILIGDSAEKDYEIYNLIKDKYPKSIHQIIIIKAGNRKNESRIVQDLKSTNDNIILVNSYEELMTDLN